MVTLYPKIRQGEMSQQGKMHPKIFDFGMSRVDDDEGERSNFIVYFRVKGYRSRSHLCVRQGYLLTNFGCD